jgi:uncharacterized membrane protein YdbT with pleckstrin-like domain
MFVPGALVLLIGSIGDKSDSAGEMAGIGLLLLVSGAVCIIFGILARSATEMAVTNKRVVIKVGLVTRRTFELLLSKVESIGVEEGPLGRALGYGSVVVRGTGGTPEPLRRVENPLEFRRQVQQQIEASEGSKVKGQSITA